MIGTGFAVIIITSVMLAVGGFFYFIEAVIGQAVLKQAGLFFGCFFVHTDIDKPMLEKTSAVYCPFAIFLYSIGSIPVFFLNSSAKRLEVE